MSKSHDDKPRPKRVSEAAPVQVFLSRDDRDVLDRLSTHLGLSKSDVLRRSLAALDRQVLDPATHPTLRLIGLVDDDGVQDGVDLARDHDAALVAGGDRRPSSKPARRRRGKP
jgi:hypothetical protein